MSYEIDYEQHPRFLRAHITGTNSAHAVASYMQDILQECKGRDCFRVLIHEELEGPRLEPDDVFRIVSEGTMRALGVFDALAYVDPKMGDMARFAESLAVNRGMPVKTFDTVEAATTWLNSLDDESDGRDLFSE